IISKGSTYLNVQHIDSTGALKASNFGVTFFNTTWVNGAATIDTVDVSKEGKGGVLVAWTDNRSGTNKHVYGQKLVGDSTRLWAINGAVIAAKQGEDQKNARVLSDGLGGMFAVWQNTNDVSTARLYKNGTLTGLGAPSNLRASPNGNGVKIYWNKYIHPMLQKYRVVRGTTSGFDPAAGVNVGVPPDTFIVDYPTPLSTPFYYRVATVDSLNITGAYSPELKVIPMSYGKSLFDNANSTPTGIVPNGRRINHGKFIRHRRARSGCDR
ncbi:MAG: hypothetical protein M1426_04270, partial [Patescibacteria group bacterium]|nr:hypothetical protein [Patescibacteria group bacterium]